MFRTLLSWTFRALLAALLLAGLFTLLARFNDGPMGPFPGGELRRGEIIEDPETDLSFLRDVQTVELQNVSPPVSRNTWVLVHQGLIYVPCGFPRFKSWPAYVEADPNVVLRVRGLRYERRLIRVESPDLIARLTESLASKYGTAGMGDVIFYRVMTRY